MRGVIFKAYTEFIKDRFDSKTLDKVLQSDDYPNNGGFSALGNYKSGYMVALINGSSQFFNCTKNEIVRQFGKFTYGYLFNRFKKMYGEQSTILNLEDPFDFLENLNTLHFAELQKLYPNAKFPEFDIERLDKEHIILEYSSFRDLPYLTYGLIEGYLEYFNNKATVSMVKTKKQKEINGTISPVYKFEVRNNG